MLTLHQSTQNLNVSELPDWAREEVVPKRERFFKLPVKLLGMLLDHRPEKGASASAAAIKLLAINISKPPSFVLNVRHVHKEYRVSERSFKAGLRLLKKRKVIERESFGGRRWAQEQPIPQCTSGERFVKVRPCDLTLSADVLAFGLAVAAKGGLVQPASIAKRLGITAAETVRELVKAAKSAGLIQVVKGCRGKVFVARADAKIADLVKNDLIENDTVKSDPTQDRWKEDSLDGRSPSKNENHLAHGTRFDETGHPLSASHGHNAEYIVLQSWRRTKFFQEIGVEINDYCDGSVSLQTDWWCNILRSHFGECQIPGHLLQPGAAREVKDLADFLAGVLNLRDVYAHDWFIANGIAFEIAKAVSAGKQIQSLGVVAVPLYKKSWYGGDEWMYDLPTYCKRYDDSTEQLGESYMRKLEASGAEVDERALMSVPCLNDLARMIASFGTDVLDAVIVNRQHVEWTWDSYEADAELFAERRNSQKRIQLRPNRSCRPSY